MNNTHTSTCRFYVNRVDTSEGTAPEMVFTMGLPAAGKSTYVERALAATHNVIDPDEVKKTLPGYDPKNPMTTHAESKAITDRMFADALDSGDGLHVVDGTGCKPEKMIKRIQRSRAAGFTVRLVYIECSLDNSLLRNSQRERLVPEHVIREKATQIEASYAAIKDYADSVRVVNTDD